MIPKTRLSESPISFRAELRGVDEIVIFGNARARHCFADCSVEEHASPRTDGSMFAHGPKLPVAHRAIGMEDLLRYLLLERMPLNCRFIDINAQTGLS